MITDSFFDFICSVENAPLKNTKDPKYIVHDSPEGGLKTIGYGHKLNVMEKTLRAVYGMDIDLLSEDQCQHILAVDLSDVQRSLSQTVPAWEKRSLRQQEMLTDFQFNLGSVAGVFPKFYAAVLSRDLDTQRAEYERKYRDSERRWHPLKERNKLFYARYLSPTAVKGWDEL